MVSMEAGIQCSCIIFTCIQQQYDRFGPLVEGYWCPVQTPLESLGNILHPRELWCGSHLCEWSLDPSWCRLGVFPRVRGAMSWGGVHRGEWLRTLSWCRLGVPPGSGIIEGSLRVVLHSFVVPPGGVPQGPGSLRVVFHSVVVPPGGVPQGPGSLRVVLHSFVVPPGGVPQGPGLLRVVFHSVVVPPGGVAQGPGSLRVVLHSFVLPPGGVPRDRELWEWSFILLLYHLGVFPRVRGH